MEEKDSGFSSVYEEIEAKLDLGRFVPIPRDGIEWAKLVTRHGEAYYVLKCAAIGKYMKLDERDYYIFSRMDGERPIKQIVLDYFYEFKTFGFQRVAAVTDEVRHAGFLANGSARLYDQITRKIRPPAIQRAATWAWNAFLHKEFAVKGIDGFVTKFYNTIGWIPFTLVSQAMMVVVSLAGIVAFAALFCSGKYAFLQTNDSYALGVITLLCINLVVIAVHESAHALATKHFKRTVTRGGIMLYFGMPAFFVDTSDMHLSSARKRIAVSWAGPAIELALGGACAIFVWFTPEATIAPVLYKFSAFFFIGIIINMNPLLELDGYYMLEDFLEIPNLRRRSIAFVKKRLCCKLLQREKFTTQERFLAVFGGFAGAYSVLIIFLALFIMKTRLVSTITDLADRGGVVSWIIIGGLVAAVALPLCFMVFMRLVTAFTSALNYALRTQLFRSTPKASIVTLAFVLTIPLVVWLAGAGAGPTRLVGAACCAAAALAVAYSGRLFAGSPLRATFILMGLALIALAVRWAATLLNAPVAADYALYPVALCFAAAGAVELIRKLSFDRWAIPLQAVSFAVAAIVTIWLKANGHGYPGALAAGGAALFIFHWVDFSVSAFWPAGVALALGAVTGEIAQAGGFGALSLGSGLAMLAGAFLLVQIFTTAGVRKVPDTKGRRLTDSERLRVALEYMLEGFTDRLDAVIGTRYHWRQNINAWVKKKRLPVNLAEDTLEVKASTRLLNLAGAGNRIIRYMSEIASDAIGKAFTQRAIQGLFARLNWQEREVLENYCMKNIELAGDASESFRCERMTRQDILQANPIFAALEEEEVSRVAAAFSALDFPDAAVIVREGDPGDRFYVISSGEVEVTRQGEGERPELLAVLTRGDYFGEIALLRDVPRTATCSALGPVTALVLERAGFNELVRERFDLLGKVESAAALTAMVRKMPLFSEFPPSGQAEVVRTLENRAFKAGEYIIRQGEKGDEFFIIVSGAVDVLVANDSGVENKVAHLGKGEYFGEIALIEDVPRTASVQAAVNANLAVLKRSGFEKLVKAKMGVAGRLEQTGSRRTIDTKHKTTIIEPTR